MNKVKAIPVLLIFIFLNCFIQSAKACSMYKVTVNGKTMVGCNQDAWRKTTSIWFEKSTNENEYGVCFTGSRMVGPNKFAPQSGMNEKGLVFSRLVAYHPNKNLNQKKKKQITNEVQYLTDILHKCRTIDEVKRYIERYNHSFFLEDVFIYIDKSGDYLVVEPYELIRGNDPSYVLANFCPSVTSNQNARKQMRYKDGEDYLIANGLATSLDFCRSLSDTMSVCRARNGDGTLLTSIWDVEAGLVNLYFYHNYEHTVQFNLAKELALGDHTISIPNLFPANPEFERYLDYKTPFNVNSLRVALAFLGGGLFFLSFLYLISYFKKRNSEHFSFVKLLFLVLNLISVVYLVVLTTNINIYYFDAPYVDSRSNLISLFSYFPFLLLLLIVPITVYNSQYFKFNSKSKWTKSLLLFNNFTYLFLIIGFWYWGLFDVL